MSVSWKIECTDGKKDSVSLGLGKTVIGRGHLLQIRELKVSRHHAEVQITEDGEFILKAMHPGLPCFYKKKGAKNSADLLRGSTIKLEEGDVFSLHANPDCEFRVIQSSEDANGADEEDGDDLPSSTVKDDEEKKKDVEDDNNEEEGGDEEDENASDSSEPVRKKTSKTSRTKKPKGANKKNARNSRKPPSSKKRKVASSEEEEASGDESDDSEFAGRRGKRRSARSPPRLPSRRSNKPITYNEDLMLDGFSPSEEEEESDGLPKIGRQKKPDSDSDFKADEDSGSNWEDRPSRKSKSRPPPKITPVRRRRKKRGPDSDESEPEYLPRPSRRRGGAAPRSNKRTKCKFGEECFRKNKDHKADFIHPGDSDWSDSSQDEKEKESASDSSDHEKSDHEKSDHEKSDHEKSDHEKSDHEKSDHEKSDHEKSDHEKSDHEESGQENSDKEKNDASEGSESN